MTLSQYVTTHETIRNKMIAARYSYISDPRTTVEVLIDGLRFNPEISTVGVQPISLNPQDVKGFIHKINRITSYTSFQNPTECHVVSRTHAGFIKAEAYLIRPTGTTNVDTLNTLVTNGKRPPNNTRKLVQ